MIKTRKGQIVITEVLFAIVIIILMFLLLLKLAEIEVYKNNSDKITEKLNYIGILAYNKSLNNPQINCKVTDSRNAIYVPGTINKNATITKAKLGIPGDYHCYFSVTNVRFATNECTQIPVTDSESYFVDFKVITCDSQITKEQYNKNITGRAVDFNQERAELRVWRK